MTNFASVAAYFLSSLSWISASVSDSHIMEVQSGEDVTLMCSNFSTVPTQIIWFRMIKRSRLHCICSMFKPGEPVQFCPGFQNRKFEMSTDLSSLFLKINHVDSLDSGLYFCGYKSSNNSVIVEATNLEVHDVFDGLRNGILVILGAMTVFLIMTIIYLLFKIKKLQKEAHGEELNLQQVEMQSSDNLDYAAVKFLPKKESHHRPASEREVDPNVIYSSTR